MHILLCCFLQHLVGHFGGAWQLQKLEFPAFPGPILVTANCVIEPMKSYKNRLFTSNETGWPGCHHLCLPDDVEELVTAALKEPGFSEEDCKPGHAPGSDKTFTVGFGRDTILSNADKVSTSCMLLYECDLVLVTAHHSGGPPFRGSAIPEVRHCGGLPRKEEMGNRRLGSLDYLKFSVQPTAFVLMFAICRRPSVCLSYVVCHLLSATFVHPTQAIEIFGNVSTPFWYLGHLRPFSKNFTEIVPGEPLRGGVKPKRGRKM